MRHFGAQVAWTRRVLAHQQAEEGLHECVSSHEIECEIYQLVQLGDRIFAMVRERVAYGFEDPDETDDPRFLAALPGSLLVWRSQPRSSADRSNGRIRATRYKAGLTQLRK